jgi:hypothetical protein
MIDIMDCSGSVVSQNADPDILTEFGFSHDEICGIIDALGVTDEIETRQGYIVKLNNTWLRRLACDTVIEAHDGRPKIRDIAAAMGVTVNNAVIILDRAKKKLKKAGKLRKFLRASLGLRRLREGEYVEVTIREKITIETGW